MKRSAGLLLYRYKNKDVEVFLVHPGGPFWAKKEIGSWSIPKGEIEEGKDPFLEAIREMKEETGISIAIVGKDFIELSDVMQNPGKIVLAWATEADFITEELTSNFFEMEWPPRSGKYQSFPEIDKGEWFSFDEARKKILAGQTPLLEELQQKLSDLKNNDV